MPYKIQALSKKDFPKRLTEIPQPPKQLWHAGTIPDETAHKFLCVVGSRKYTSYGREVCEKIISGLAGHPIVIVSGLALGIDAIAHKAALGARLKTVAVPGSGLDQRVLYPSSNRQLGERIVESGGVLLSEFEPMMRAALWTFPQRNRIMAGLSHAVLVIEAEKKSGTLITSRLATEYNRDVFTVPGSVFSPASEGPHMLLRLGATPITSSSDILEAFGFAGEQAKLELSYDDCSPNERALLELLREPLEKDELIRRSELSASEANIALGILELKGYIKESLGEIRLN